MFARFRPAPFAVSLLTHGLILAWVASGPVREKPASLYAQTIALHQSKLVWYDFRQKLPDVAPSASRRAAKPPRALVKIPKQQIVAGSRKAPRARQFVWQPAPKLEIHADLRSPNVLAVHAPRPEPPPKPKLFVPPPDRPKPLPDQSVPAPPEVQVARNLSGPGNLLGVHPAKAPPRKFVAPRAGRPVEKPAPAMPAAPVVSEANPSLAAPDALANNVPRAQPRDFVAPKQKAQINRTAQPLPETPALAGTASPSAVSMAIVGLDPTASAPAPVPEGSRDVQLSAGPRVRKDGSDGSSEGALLTVPGLLIRSGEAAGKPALIARASPTSAANLRAAIRSAAPPASIAVAHPGAIRVNSAPDPTWSGRETYAMSVQMPNVTSYSGSWMIWFSERHGSSGGVLSPPCRCARSIPSITPPPWPTAWKAKFASQP